MDTPMGKIEGIPLIEGKEVDSLYMRKSGSL
uniref:Uncharacterized protein n=1 Tax=Rhizophora mucronata TaxID=61149 RepID=A0A2P2N2A0_RHIMU